MVRELIQDTEILRKKSKAATAADKAIAQDLVDTLQANIQDMFQGNLTPEEVLAETMDYYTTQLIDQ